MKRTGHRPQRRRLLLCLGWGFSCFAAATFSVAGYDTSTNLTAVSDPAELSAWTDRRLMTLSPMDLGETNLSLSMLVMPKSEELVKIPSKALFELDPALQHAPELLANSSLVFRSQTGN